MNDLKLILENENYKNQFKKLILEGVLCVLLLSAPIIFVFVKLFDLIV